MGNPKISVIVPIYCAERYLEQCVDSLLKQTLNGIEIILVDDGSPDRCGEMADRYAAQYPHIRTVHQQNAGLGAARNAGLAVAVGEYVAFLDSDDWVREELYHKLYEAAVQKNADIVVSGHCDVANGKVVVAKAHPMAGTSLSSAHDIEQIRRRLYGVDEADGTVEAFPMSACMSLYRRSMLAENDLQFPDGISEDTLFNLKAYRYAQCISFIPVVDYCYRKEEQPSLTYTLTDSKYLAYRDFLVRLKNMADQENDEECRIRAKRTAIDTCRLYIGIVENARLSKREKVAYVRMFAQNQEIKECWSGYPVSRLPIQQRVFHMLIECGWYAMALLLSRIRQNAKKRGQ